MKVYKQGAFVVIETPTQQTIIPRASFDFDPIGQTGTIKMRSVEDTFNSINEVFSNIEKEEKEFLIKAAYRHTVFNYQSIADFYAHSNKEVQELMEDSALVIIDFNKAIENGYVKLSKEIEQSYLADYGE